MKSPPMALALLALVLAPLSASATAASAPRSITQVVNLLETMLQDSKAEGNTEREMYGKYKCYCDTNEEEKTEQIASLTEEIALVESEIEELQASNGALSKEVAKLKADMEANMASQGEATALREKENLAFQALEADLTGANETITLAIQTLADIGADQTMEQSAEDHKYMMAGYGENALLMKKVHIQVKQALLAASAFVNKKQTGKVEAFLQAPFTATYTAQAGEVVGILKDMKDTFLANLAQARKTEATALEGYQKFMLTMGEAYSKMDASHLQKQGELSSNDGSLSAKKLQLSTAETSKEEAQEFLAELLDMCSAKAKEYKERTLLRTNEEAAIAEAISILNSDAAFATFGTVSASSTGGTGAAFFQRRSIRRHVQREPVKAVREAVQEFLAPRAKKSQHVSQVLAMLQANNPFKVVLEEITKMIALITEEGKQDTEQLNWCDNEREVNNQELATKNGEKIQLEADILALDTLINAPETGLKAQIDTSEKLLEENLQNQKSETADRKEENVVYQKDVANLVEAEALLKKAVTVLKAYYDKIERASLVQKGAQPAPPSTWQDGPYQGQSSNGVSAISMIEFILSETQKEETNAHDFEQNAQHAYEDMMGGLKTEQAALIRAIAELKTELAEKEEELLGKRADLKATLEAIAAIEAYLKKIKPGCDFISENIALRNTNRGQEITALERAEGLIKASPAYMEAMAIAHNETLGDCKDICAVHADHVDCKACVAKTSVPGYCAGHPGTVGCEA